MNIEDQVCSLDAAKKLKDLGVVQDSFMWWIENPHPSPGSPLWIVGNGEVTAWYSEKDKRYSAYTVAELGMMLNHTLDEDEDEEIYFTISDCGNFGDGDERCFTVWCFSDWSSTMYKMYKTEAEARAQTIIQLLEANELTIEQINNRLK